jgi:1-acyl-sn-glycerol-3-phosphate acyltransferase
MKRSFGVVLSKILTYRRSTRMVRWAIRMSNCWGIYRLHLTGRVPDRPCVIVFRHGFKAFGKVADFYLIGGIFPNRVRGIFYPGLFANGFCSPFLKEWGGIPSNRLFHIHKLLRPEESIAIALDGLEAASSESGYLGAAWIAQRTGLPLLPLKIATVGRSVGVHIKEQIPVPADADRQALRAITDDIFARIND